MKPLNMQDGGLVSTSAEDLIKKWEGFRDKAYQDVAGVWTIGYGRTEGVQPGSTTTRQQEDAWLSKRVQADRHYVLQTEAHYGYDWNDRQVNALTSFIYNLGRGALKQLTDSGRRDNETIAQKIKLYVNAGGQYVQGLANRREEEAAMFASGITGGSQPKGNFQHPSSSNTSSSNSSTNSVDSESSLAPVYNKLISQDFTQTYYDGGVVYRNRGGAAYGTYQEASQYLQGGPKHEPSLAGAIDIVTDFTPIIGDIKGGVEIMQELRKNPINWVAVSVLAGALIISLVPGVGDAIAKTIKNTLGVAAKAGVLSVGKLKQIFVAAKRGDVDEIMAHIDELTAKAEAAGWKVEKTDSDFQAAVGESGDKTINIPKGFSKQEYLIVLEEFSHAFEAIDKGLFSIPGNRVVGGTQIAPGVRIAEEIRAKTDALREGSKRVSIRPEDLSEWKESFKSYLGLPLAWSKEGFYAVDAAKQLGKIPEDVWELLEIPRPNVEGLVKKEPKAWQDYLDWTEKYNIPISTNFDPKYHPDGVSLAAKTAKNKTFYIKHPDGSVEEFTGTPAEFSEEFGVGISAVKKGKGRIKNPYDGSSAQFSTDPEGFKEFKTGQTVAQEDFIDPMTVEAKSGARMSWKNFTEAERTQVEGAIADVLAPKLEAKTPVDMELTNEGYVSGDTGYVDFNTNKSIVGEAVEEAWPEVVEALEVYKDKGSDAYNKLLVWAKTQMRKPFDSSFQDQFNFGFLSKAGGEGISSARQIAKLESKGYSLPKTSALSAPAKKILENNGILKLLLRDNSPTVLSRNHLTRLRQRIDRMQIGVSKNPDGSYGVAQGLIMKDPGMAELAIREHELGLELEEAYDEITKAFELQDADDVFKKPKKTNELIAVETDQIDKIQGMADEYFDDYGAPDKHNVKDFTDTDREMVDELIDELDPEYPDMLRSVRSIYTAEGFHKMDQSKRMISEIFSTFDPAEARKGWMVEPEQRAWDMLPERIKVYRLQTEGDIDGVSWTFSDDLAKRAREQFATTGTGDRVVYSAEVNKDDIYGLFLDQDEFEIVVPASKVSNVHRTDYRNGGLVC